MQLKIAKEHTIAPTTIASTIHIASTTITNTTPVNTGAELSCDQTDSLESSSSLCKSRRRPKGVTKISLRQASLARVAVLNETAFIYADMKNENQVKKTVRKGMLEKVIADS